MVLYCCCSDGPIFSDMENKRLYVIYGDNKKFTALLSGT